MKVLATVKGMRHSRQTTASTSSVDGGGEHAATHSDVEPYNVLLSSFISASRFDQVDVILQVCVSAHGSRVRCASFAAAANCWDLTRGVVLFK